MQSEPRISSETFVQIIVTSMGAQVPTQCLVQPRRIAYRLGWSWTDTTASDKSHLQRMHALRWIGWCSWYMIVPRGGGHAQLCLFGWYCHSSDYVELPTEMILLVVPRQFVLLLRRSSRSNVAQWFPLIVGVCNIYKARPSPVVGIGVLIIFLASALLVLNFLYVIVVWSASVAVEVY